MKDITAQKQATRKVWYCMRFDDLEGICHVPADADEGDIVDLCYADAEKQLKDTNMYDVGYISDDDWGSAELVE